MTELKEIVRELLDNARANGYNFDGWDPEKIADDMCYYADDALQNYTMEDVVLVLKEILDNQWT